MEDMDVSNASHSLMYVFSPVCYLNVRTKPKKILGREISYIPYTLSYIAMVAVIISRR